MLSNKKFVEGILYEIKLVGGTSDLVSLWNWGFVKSLDHDKLVDDMFSMIDPDIHNYYEYTKIEDFYLGISIDYTNSNWKEEFLRLQPFHEESNMYRKKLLDFFDIFDI
jgi:hypothetical protein